MYLVIILSFSLRQSLWVLVYQIFTISLCGHFIHFVFKICQTVVCIFMINSFHEFLVVTNYIAFQLPVMTSMEIRVLIKVEFQCSDHPAIKFPRMCVLARASKKHLTWNIGKKFFYNFCKNWIFFFENWNICIIITLFFSGIKP